MMDGIEMVMKMKRMLSVKMAAHPLRPLGIKMSPTGRTCLIRGRFHFGRREINSPMSSIHDVFKLIIWVITAGFQWRTPALKTAACGLCRAATREDSFLIGRWSLYLCFYETNIIKLGRETILNIIHTWINPCLVNIFENCMFESAWHLREKQPISALCIF